MEFKFLTNDFYKDFDKDKYPEISRKNERPYTQTLCSVDNLLFAIPLRSSISHKHVLWSDKDKGCGLDFSKAVLILDKEKYIDDTTKPHIRDNEYKALLGQEYIVKTKMEKHIKDYKKAKQNLEIRRNRELCNCSTLQYFEEHIYTSEELSKKEVATSNEFKNMNLFEHLPNK